MKTLFLSPLQPQNAWGVQVPTSEAAVSADTHAFARLPPGGLRKNRNWRGLGGFLWGKGPRPLAGRAPSPGGPGPKPPGDLAHRPLGPGSRHSHWLTPHNPQSLTLGGVGWCPKAELYSSMKGGGFPSLLQHFSCWAGPSPC